LRYFFRRIFLIFPTLLGILAVNFFIVNLAPGGPIDYALSRLYNAQTESGADGKQSAMNTGSNLASGQGLAGDSMRADLVEKLRKQFHFDAPLGTRFVQLLKDYSRFDLGQSYFKGASVRDLIFKRIPVSLSLGLWTTLLIYLMALPLGVLKAVRNGSRFDTWTSVLVMSLYAVPSFLFALVLVLVFAGGSFWSFFPLRGLVSSDWDQLSLLGKVGDYFWHIALPTAAQVLCGFAGLTLLTKNAVVEEIQKTYVTMGRALGLGQRTVLVRFVLRNALILVIAGLPSTLLNILFSGSFLIEMIFSIDGMGLLAYEAVSSRDYPVIFGSLYLFSLMALLTHVLSDWLYTRIDPRVNYEKISV
jgi:microcin C transport system permease protein